MIQRISTLEEFSALKAEWEGLYNASRRSNLFLTHAWLENWLVHFGEGKWVVLIERETPNSDMMGLALFKTHKKHFSFIGSEHSNFPGFLTPYGKTGIMQGFLDHLTNHEGCRSLALIQSPDEPSFEQDVRDAAGYGWFIIKKNQHALRSIALSADYAAYLSGRDKKVRHELKRKVHKLQNSGETALRRFENGSETEELFRIIDDIEKDGWKFKSGTAIISSENESSFYKSVFNGYAKTSCALAYVLSHNKIPLSYVMGVVFDKTFYALKTSYKESYRKLSPGTVLFARVIENLVGCDEKVKKIELLGGDARWKKELATDRRNLCTYHLFAKSLRNVCYLAGRKCAKEVMERLVLRRG